MRVVLMSAWFARLTARDGGVDCFHMAKETSNEEILEAVSKGFSGVETKLNSLEERLGMKIDRERSSLDAEILRRVDDYAELKKRITNLEKLHGLDRERRTVV